MKNYVFKDWFSTTDVGGFIQATLEFGGLEFDVTYDFESDWRNYKIDLNGQVPMTTCLLDDKYKSLSEAVSEAQINLSMVLRRAA